MNFQFNKERYENKKFEVQEGSKAANKAIEEPAKEEPIEIPQTEILTSRTEPLPKAKIVQATLETPRTPSLQRKNTFMTDKIWPSDANKTKKKPKIKIGF